MKSKPNYTPPVLSKNAQISLMWLNPPMMSYVIIPSMVRIGRMEDQQPWTKHLLWTQCVLTRDHPCFLTGIWLSLALSSRHITWSISVTIVPIRSMYVAWSTLFLSCDTMETMVLQLICMHVLHTDIKNSLPMMSYSFMLFSSNITHSTLMKYSFSYCKNEMFRSQYPL